jgi:hypothetical protein
MLIDHILNMVLIKIFGNGEPALDARKLLNVCSDSLAMVFNLLETLQHVNALARLAQCRLSQERVDDVDSVLTSIIAVTMSKMEEIFDKMDEWRVEYARSTDKEDKEG